MNIQHLRYFVVIANYENISKASQELMVSQPALSNVLQQLESELGASLFDRQGKKISLNQTGRAFLYTAKGVLRMLDSNIQYLRETSWLSGTLQICLTASCNELYELIADYSREFPTVQLKVMGAEKLSGDPELSPFDLIVTSDCENNRTQVCIAKRETMYAIVRADHVLANREAVKLEELRDEWFCFVSRQDDKLEHAYVRCTECGFVPKVRYITDSSSCSLNLIRTGSCIGLTYNTKLQMADSPILRLIRVTDAPIGRTDIYLRLLHRDSVPLAKHFFRFVCDRLRITGEAEGVSKPG